MKHDFRDGFIANIPIGFSVFAYGSVCGMLSMQKGITLLEMTLMNLFIFAGSAQFIIVDMWSSTLDVIGIITAAIMINLRYFLMGASLSPLFINSTTKEKFAFMHLVADENWAVTINARKQRAITPYFLFGGGICLLLIWSLGTTSGFLLGGLIAEPEKYGLDFAFIAIFTALTFNMYKGKQDILPWFIAASVAVLSEMFIPGKLYIVFGALAGSISAVMLHKEDA